MIGVMTDGDGCGDGGDGCDGCGDGGRVCDTDAMTRCDKGVMTGCDGCVPCRCDNGECWPW